MNTIAFGRPMIAYYETHPPKPFPKRSAMQATTLQSSAIHRGIDETNRKFENAFTSENLAAALQQVYTRDARVLPPGSGVVEGRDQITQFWEGAVKQFGITAVRLSTRDVQATDTLVAELGEGVLVLGGGQEIVCKYVVVWKQEDGAWRIHYDIWNM
jgi:uncharacterized protein (TIGR02246 family)